MFLPVFTFAINQRQYICNARHCQVFDGASKLVQVAIGRGQEVVGAQALQFHEPPGINNSEARVSNLRQPHGVAQQGRQENT